MTLSLGPFTQTTFLGASISAFSASVGWNEQQGTLNVKVYEDSSNNDLFDPPTPGNPVYFQFDQFKFGGILQSSQRDNSFSEKPGYNVVVNDPREIVEGCQLILEGYNGSTMGIPNLVNVYGYLESIGFGSSQVNEAGIPWYLIKQALDVLVSSPSPIGATYGGPGLNLMGNRYLLDLSEMPLVPTYYRIGGGNIGLLEAITQVCQDAGYDYFFRLVSDPNLGNIIQLKTVSRRLQPKLGKILSYVNNTDGVNANSYGLELRNETTTAFVVGGQVCNLYFQEQSITGPGTEEFNTIWPFWGFDENGNTVLGQGDFQSMDHTFTLDSRSVNIAGVGGTYQADVGEMRAALAGEDAWKSYIQLRNPFRSQAVGILGPFADGAEALNWALQGIPIKPAAHINQDKKWAAKAAERNVDPLAAEKNVHSLYEFVSSFAQEYYGRKFMVRIPFVNGKVQPETLITSLSQEPTDGGWMEDGAEPLGLPDVYQDLFQAQDGRFQAFIRMDNPTASGYDLSNLSPDDGIVVNETLFLKVDVDPQVQFIDRSTLYNPRVIITLPGPVNVSGEALSKPWFDGLFLALQNKLQQNAAQFGQNASPLTDDQKKALVNGMAAGAGGFNYFGLSPFAVMPTFAAIPLKSNVMTYGPWYNIGPPGKVRFERDESLVPWNFGGFSIMNLAGQARVADAITAMQIGEIGSIDQPGAPTVQLGDVLQAGGPNVTQIDVTIGKEGVTTNYRMRTYTPHPLGFAKANADRFSRLARGSQQLRRAVRQIFRTPAVSSPFFAERQKGFMSPFTSKLFQGRSPHDVMMANVIQSTGDYKVTCVSDATFTEGIASCQAHDDNLYQQSAVMSMDGLFRPYSVDVNYTGLMSHFETPSGSYPTINDLNPFGTGGKVMTDIGYATHGDTYPDNGPDSLSTNDPGFQLEKVRGIGFKTPMMLVGYGHDVANHPVPSGDDGKFLDNYRNRPDKWKVGPLDVRWDDNRKVWGINSQSQAGVIVLLSGAFVDSGRPKYIVRLANSISSGGVIQIDSIVNKPPGQSTSDIVTFNIQEGAGESHSIGVGTPVILENQFGVKFMNEPVRTLIRRVSY